MRIGRPSRRRVMAAVMLLAPSLAVPVPARAASVLVMPAGGGSHGAVVARGAGFAPRHPAYLTLAGRRVARTLVDPAGRFRVALHPRRSGALITRAAGLRTINVLGSGRAGAFDIATSAGARVRVEAGPVVAGGTLRAIARGLRPGATVRLHPAGDSPVNH